MNLKNTKLFQFVSHHYQEEGPSLWVRFEKYLASPLLNPDKSLHKFGERFWTLVIKGDIHDAEQFYGKALKGADYNPGYLRERMSMLLRAFQRFLAYTHYESDPFAFHYHLIQQMRERQQHGHFLQVIGNGMEALQRSTLEDEDFFHHRMLLLHEHVSYELKYAPRDGRVSFSDLEGNLDAYYAIRKLRYAQASVTSSNEHGKNISSSSLAPFLTYLRSLADRLHPLVNSYLLAYDCAAYPEEAGPFQKLCADLAQRGIQLSNSAATELFVTAINYCQRRINKGESEYLSQCNGLYDLYLRQILIPRKLELPPTLLKNRIALLIQMGQEEEALSSYLQLSSLVLSGSENKGMMMAKALLKVSQNELPAAERLIHQVLDQNPDVFLGITARGLLWKIDFLRRDWDSFGSRYHMLRAFLNAQKAVSASYRVSYVHFIQAFKQFGDVVQRSELRGARGMAGKLEALKENVSLKENLIQREWLLKQINRLLASA